MALLKVQPYRQLSQLIQNETFEPLFSWGLRMAISATAPIIWGLATGQLLLASWITLSAECICWVELKGSFPQRMRVLFAGTLLAFFFTLLGSITASSIWFSVMAILLVGFTAALFKNLGERGIGLAVCVQVLFIISNAYPVASLPDLKERLLLVLVGGAWTTIAGIAASALVPLQQPYRRTIALIWRANAGLIAAVARGWDGAATRSSTREIYLKEKEIRAALDSSFHFYETMADQVSKKEKKEYQLAQLRKATALVATNIIAMTEELERVRIRDVDKSLRLGLHSAFKALQQAIERMSVYVVTLKPEEELLIYSRIDRLNKSIILLKEHVGTRQDLQQAVKRVVQLMERTVRLMERSIERLKEIEDDVPVFRSYSLIKTLFVLQPKHWLRNLQLFFNLNTNNTRYAIRSAVAAAAGVFIYKWYHIDHGYWLPFTVLIVVQPYFTATLKKAIERVLGTLAGGLAGGLLIRLPAGLYAKELMLFFCFLFMVYFIRKRYAVAVFFVTISVVLLFDVEETFNPMLIVTRALCTAGGAALGILAGFALLPTWDKKLLPKYISDALYCNYRYFLASFYPQQETNWTRNKRSAESKNSNAYDSFSRYVQEPSLGKRNFMPYFRLINHSVRITRELNNIHLEKEHRTDETKLNDTTEVIKETQRLIAECQHWFHEIIKELQKRYPQERSYELHPMPAESARARLSFHQCIYLDKLLVELTALYNDVTHINEKIAGD